MGLGERTVRGLLSNGISKAVLVGVNIAITAILARLLEPEDFGLIGMVTVFTVFLSMLGSLGFDSAIVQKPAIEQSQLSTLFWIKVWGGVVLAAMLALGAYPISLFYREPRLVAITQCLSLVFLTSSVYQTHRSLLRKDLRFSAIALNTVISVIGCGVIGVTMAYLGGGVWSLVAQALSLEVISALLYWWSSRWRPSPVFALKETAPVIRFGLTMTGASFTLYVQRNIDMILIGRLLGATPLGFYALAYKLMYSPVRQISYIFTDVLFPSFSRIQDDPAAVRRGYLRSLKLISLITLPTMTLVSPCAYDLVMSLFGGEWLPAATILAVMAPAGAIQSLAQVAYVLYPVMNRPDLALKLGAFNCVALASGVLIGVRYGVVGAAWGILAATTVNWLLTETYASRLLELRWIDLVKTLSSSIIGCGLIAAIGTFTRWFLFSSLSPSHRLLLVATLSAFSYGLFLLLAERIELKNLLKLIYGAMNPQIRQRMVADIAERY